MTPRLLRGSTKGRLWHSRRPLCSRRGADGSRRLASSGLIAVSSRLGAAAASSPLVVAVPMSDVTEQTSVEALPRRTSASFKASTNGHPCTPPPLPWNGQSRGASARRCAGSWVRERSARLDTNGAQGAAPTAARTRAERERATNQPVGAVISATSTPPKPERRRPRRSWRRHGYSPRGRYPGT